MRLVRRIISVVAILVAYGTVARASPAIITDQQAIINAATVSKCASYSWKHKQGVAPIGFTRGVALTFANSYAALKRGQTGAPQLISAVLGSPDSDALAKYAAESAALPVATAVERMETDYGLLLGLGMVESSGRTTIGAPSDKANPKPAAETAEAGLFQTSADSLDKSPVLVEIEQKYLVDRGACAFDLFTNGKNPVVTPAIGAGSGQVFQQLTKSCPSFATEYAAVMIRIDLRHYGTLRTSKAEYTPVCQAMFKSIEIIVDGDR